MPRATDTRSRAMRVRLRLIAPLAMLTLGACAQAPGIQVAGFGLWGGAMPETERLAAPPAAIASPLRR